MAKAARIRKINLGPSDPVTKKNSLNGMTVIADYLHPTTGQRTLVLERPDGTLTTDKAPAAAPAKRRKRRTPASTAPVVPASPATSFNPPAEVRS